VNAGGPLHDRVIVVTGGGSGIGAATVRHAAAEGARIAVLDRRDSDGVADAPGVHFVACDVTDHEMVEAALEQTTAEIGQIDGLVASAGINGVLAPIEDLHPDEWRQTLSVCLDGTFNAIHGAVPRFAERGGSIVVLASITGTRSFATEGGAAYAAAKAGVTALAQIAAVELGPRRIRVNAVAPGAVLDTRLWNERTAIRNLDRLAHERRIDSPLAGAETSADDVAQLILFLLGPASRRVSGAVIHIDGAQSLLGGGILKDAAPIELDPPKNPQLGLT
jgi:NAD(P)-dependent dehydrogenase (short-subunit alcohol dehydrogenase family)